MRCVKGRVLDVAVDIRKGSPTYGKHVAVELTEDNHRATNNNMNQCASMSTLTPNNSDKNNPITI